MDAKFDALEELFIQIYGRGQVSCIDQPSAENDFLSEKPECGNDPPITECPIPTLLAGNVQGFMQDENVACHDLGKV